MKGIILAGGQSRRMGRDKGLMSLGGIPLVQLAAERMAHCCDEVLISVHRQQQDHYQAFGRVILDEYEEQGPLGGILSALTRVSGPVMFTPVDLPLLRAEELIQLRAHHSPESLVTAFFDEEEKRWEALVSLWEPASLAIVEEYFSQNKRSVQRLLNEIDAQQVHSPHRERFANVNSPGDWATLHSTRNCLIPPAPDAAMIESLLR